MLSRQRRGSIEQRQTGKHRITPKTKPTKEPTKKENWFMPKAFPRSFSGKASVRMAALLENRNEALQKNKIVRCDNYVLSGSSLK